MTLFRATWQEVHGLFRRSRQLRLSHAAIQRLHWFAFALQHGGNVSLTCRHFGIARSSFLRWAKRFDPRNPDSLEEHSRCPHTVRKPETDPRVVALIERCRREQPLLGKEKIRDLLRAEHAIEVSSSTIGRVIARHGFFFGESPSHVSKRRERALTEQPSQPLTDHHAPDTSHTDLSSDLLPEPFFGS